MCEAVRSCVEFIRLPNAPRVSPIDCRYIDVLSYCAGVIIGNISEIDRPPVLPASMWTSGCLILAQLRVHSSQVPGIGLGF